MMEGAAAHDPEGSEQGNLGKITTNKERAPSSIKVTFQWDWLFRFTVKLFIEGMTNFIRMDRIRSQSGEDRKTPVSHQEGQGASLAVQW